MSQADSYYITTLGVMDRQIGRHNQRCLLRESDASSHRIAQKLTEHRVGTKLRRGGKGMRGI